MDRRTADQTIRMIQAAQQLVDRIASHHRDDDDDGDDGELTLGASDLTDSRIPESVRHLPGLTSLAVYGETLTALPDWIGELTGLTFLSVSNKHQLTAVPDGIGNLTKLTWLDLDGNQLVEDA